MARPIRKLFVIIQPLQYLQALELLKEGEQCVLIALWANTSSQLHQLVDEKDWHKVIWLEYSGTYLDLIKNRAELRSMFKKLGSFDEVVVSAYYNALMNWTVNYYPLAKRVLLEDGTATLYFDSTKVYKTLKYRVQYYLCQVFGFDISPIDNVTLFILKRSIEIKIPKIASNVLFNDFSRLRAKSTYLEQVDAVYFISSSFISAGMMSKSSYIAFLARVAERYKAHPLNIILHRFDNESDFEPLRKIKNVSITKSSGPIELLFNKLQKRPKKVVSAGSAATETLKMIYNADVEVVIPNIESFHHEHQESMLELSNHFKKSCKVVFL